MSFVLEKLFYNGLIFYAISNFLLSASANELSKSVSVLLKSRQRLTSSYYKLTLHAQRNATLCIHSKNLCHYVKPMYLSTATLESRVFEMSSKIASLQQLNERLGKERAGYKVHGLHIRV